MYCVRCGAANPEGADVAFCQACGARLVSQEDVNRAQQPASTGGYGGAAALPLARPAVRYSKAQPIWLFALMMIATFSYYWLYWYYRTWRHIRDYGGQQVRPFWRTVGLFVPILSWFYVYGAMDHIKAMAERAGAEVKLSPALVLVAAIIANVSVAVLRVASAPAMYQIAVIAVFFGIPIGFAQHAFNQYWAAAHPEMPTRRGPSAGQAAVLAVGGILWLFVIIGAIAQMA